MLIFFSKLPIFKVNVCAAREVVIKPQRCKTGSILKPKDLKSIEYFFEDECSFFSFRFKTLNINSNFGFRPSPIKFSLVTASQSHTSKTELFQQF